MHRPAAGTRLRDNRRTMRHSLRVAGRRVRTPRAALAACLGVAAAVVIAGCGRTPATAPDEAARAPRAANATPATAEAEAVRLPLRLAADVVVRRAEFGVLETTAEGEERFVPGAALPAVEGTTFGWVLEIETQRETVHWQEHLRLPKAPRDWGDAGDDPDVLIARDGKSVAAHGEDAIEDGELRRFYWTLSTGDPAGDYELDVAIEGRTVAQFRFRVPVPVQEQAILVSNPRSVERRQHDATRVAVAPAPDPVERQQGAM